MTRTLRRPTAKHAAPPDHPSAAPSTAHRRRYRGRHRATPLRPWRRRAPYAAAGLLALAGAVGPSLVRPQARPAPRPVAARTAPAPIRIRPAAVRPAPVRVRMVTRTVEVDGRTYRGRATWYGPGFAGRRTANGEVYRPNTELTAAHRWLPFGTRLRVCRGTRCVVVRVNDRGPFGNAILDLSYLAAQRLGMVRAGIVPVTATVLTTRQVTVAS